MEDELIVLPYVAEASSTRVAPRVIAPPLLLSDKEVAARKALEHLALVDASYAQFEQEHKDDPMTKDTRTSAQRNKDYWHPIKGVADRYNARKLLGRDITDGVKRTIVPAVTGAAAITGIGNMYQAAKYGATNTIAPIIRNLVPGLTGTAGYYAGDYLGSAVGGLIDDVGNVSGFRQAGGSLGGEFGSYFGGSLGYKGMNDHLRRAIYDLVAPLGYGATDKIKIDHAQDLKNAYKEFFNPLKLKGMYQRTSSTGTPDWMRRVKDGAIQMPGAFGTKDGRDYMPASALLLFRDDVWRKAMRLPTRRDYVRMPNGSYQWRRRDPLYVSNGDGTYSYNMDYVNRVRLQHGGTPFGPEYWNPDHHYDAITSNGGGTNHWKLEGIMKDIWDLLPFEDSKRRFSTGINWFDRWAHTNPKLEGVTAVGGELINLNHKL